MARLPRYFVPAQPQHIILRGNNRQAIFAAKQDYLFFRDSRRQAYRRLFRAAMKETDLKAIRDSLHQGWALGDDRFREQIALLSERRAEPLRKGRPRKNK